MTRIDYYQQLVKFLADIVFGKDVKVVSHYVYNQNSIGFYLRIDFETRTSFFLSGLEMRTNNTERQIGNLLFSKIEECKRECGFYFLRPRRPIIDLQLPL